MGGGECRESGLGRKRLSGIGGLQTAEDGRRFGKCRSSIARTSAAHPLSRSFGGQQPKTTRRLTAARLPGVSVLSTQKP